VLFTLAELVCIDDGLDETAVSFSQVESIPALTSITVVNGRFAPAIAVFQMRTLRRRETTEQTEQKRTHGCFGYVETAKLGPQAFGFSRLFGFSSAPREVTGRAHRVLLLVWQESWLMLHPPFDSTSG
jgi:hypothetical protein